MSREESEFLEIATRFGVGGGREQWEDFDLPALRELSGSDRDHVTRILSARLGSGANDPRVLGALVALEPPDLDALLITTMRRLDDTGVAAAVTRWHRTHSTDVIGPLFDAVCSPPAGTARLAAVLVLGEIGDDRCLDHLGAALDLVDGEVRNVATTALLNMVGLSALERRGRSPISRLGALILNPLVSVRTPAAAQLRSIVQAVRGGQSAAALGLVPDDKPETGHLADLRTSVFANPREGGPWRNNIDVNAFRALTGEEQERGLQFLLLLLGEHDRRVLPALVELHLTSALPALAEAANGGDPKFRRLALEAVATLGRPHRLTRRR